ncbi:hypothetical protein KP509_35G052800 [Ceratopteris richardii]|uniref:Late embryogenesis abundant protein LEA-2 subgroup domain-containing protein n=1 Tax=Ceratopteris richardii TaxID=49495 RepID=A0A8T2QGZ7_CERRI|nr:hypothetical protein KP509_35G052800 [Ceratopteris richardii]
MAAPPEENNREQPPSEQPSAERQAAGSTTTMAAPLAESMGKTDLGEPRPSPSSAYSSRCSSSHALIRKEGSISAASDISRTSKTAPRSQPVPKDIIYRVPEAITDNHPSKRAARRRRGICRSCFCRCFCVLSILFVLVLLISVAAFVLYLIFQPQLPKIGIESLAVSKFNISDRNPSSNNASDTYASYVTADATMKVVMQNPNKKIRVVYEDLQGELSYEGTVISQALMDPSVLRQNPKNTSAAQIRMLADMVSLGKDETVSMKNDLKAHSAIHLKVSTSANVVLQLGSWESGHLNMQFNCSVQIDVRPNATVAHQPEECNTDHSKLLALHILNPFN